MNCRKCSHAPALQLVGSYKDGSLRMLCGCCQADGGVLHRCLYSHPATPPTWLPLLLAGIKVVCPECSAAYDLGVKITPVNPEVGETLKAIGLVAGVCILISAVVSEIFQSRNRRRH